MRADRPDLAADTRRRLVSSGLVTEYQLQGCSPDEISVLESHYAVTLPAMYRAFLTVAGRGAGTLLLGTDFTSPLLLGLREGAEELLRDSGSAVTLPRDAFVFLMHQGYQFSTVGTGPDLDDAPVSSFTEGDDALTQTDPTFSAFLDRTLRELGGTVA